jgi:uncharacterized protein (TIGR02453 family)
MTFNGWPAAAFELYEGLETDNTRTYWQAHRDTYEAAVRTPFLELSDAVKSKYGPLRLFRPYRDTRFAKDKSPYKTNAAAVTESHGGSSYYISISAEGMFVGCGMYHLASDQLDRWRAALDNNRTGTAIAKIVDDLRTKRYDIGSMESLKSAPRGYPKDHARVELLRMKGLTTGKTFDRSRWMQSAKALDRIKEVWDAAAPMNRWLERNVGLSTLPPPEPT